MKSVTLASVLATCALFAFACGGTTTVERASNGNSQPAKPANTNANAAPADEFAKVRATYTQVCANCHGPTGDGGPVEIEGKKLKVPSLKVGHALNHTEEQFRKQIANGGDGMPAFKDRLSADDINTMVRFLRKEIQGGAGSAVQNTNQNATK